MKTNQASFARTLTGIYPKKYILLQGMVLCAALAFSLSGWAQPQGTAQAAAKAAEQLPTVEVYKSAQCGCCKTWAEHLQKSGFKVVLHDVNDIPAARKKLGMPSQYGSCHTAKAGQYLIEGHVPAADIKRLLKERPKAIGLAVPSMPPGSPGMESDEPVPYETLLIGKDGKASVYARH
ncbi:DUF411 domain-containing protein [Candidatus Ferrigenium straubiae]|jgi:hypothetical protein|uniref:DUF411 domain-containing protein n=1 Tax=Candidatus Ferrigenium straubiae TaxID=2919506 RepID=UPI003F4ACE58